MIENAADRDPLLHLLGALSEGTGTYIEGMESAGQRQLVHSDRIPTEGNAQSLIDLGFTLGDPDPRDPMFRPCTLPEGWSREGSDHAMWSYIVDANGRQRVAIFYKAASYDRSAHFSVNTVASYVSSLMWAEGKKDPKPIVDEWTTRELLVGALTESRDRDLAGAAEMDSYYAKGAAARREMAARAQRLLVGLGAA